MKIYILSLVFCFLTLFSFAQSSIAVGDGNQSMPKFRFYTMSGVEVNDTDLKFVDNCIMIMYNPTCEHCVAGAKKILDNWDRFKNIKIYWISQSPKFKIKEFRDYYFDGKPNCVFLHDTERMMYDNFDIPELPRAFVYNQNKILLGSLNCLYPTDSFQFFKP